MQRLSGLLFGLATLLVLGSSGATPLLGKEKCTFGPSYWCENIPQAQQCNAFSHCKQTIWETHQYPVDNDEICKICLDMVTQARDQLRSNETLDDLKAVFEGSCALIPIKLVRKECDSLVDDFIPQLVEALSSEMDPTAVCSVAGLCNNKKIDALLEERAQLKGNGDGDEEYQQMYGDFNCKDCGTIGDILVKKFKESEPDDVLEAMLQGCGYMGSFSDACSSLAIVHFKRIYQILEQRLSTQNLCHLSGACSLQFHKHDELEIRPMGNVGLIRPNDQKMTGDVPCELCKQLVVHLRDIVIANTTEAEFKTVLEGVCGELGGLKDECDDLVKNYAEMIFNLISTGLNPDILCGIINICPSGANRRLIMPLITLEPQTILQSLKKVSKEPQFTKQEIDAFQLPFDQLMGPQNAQQLIDNGESCTICEFALHFIQETLAQPATEEEIKSTVEKMCNRLPKSVQPQCDQFVSDYGEAIIAMLIQEMDPSEVCPMMKLCSSKVKEDVEIFEANPMNVDIQSQDKPTCPLCLFAVTEAKTRISSNKSIENIKRTVESLCNHLPQKLNVECTDFVDSYANQLIKLLLNDLTPQDICVQLKLCPATKNPAVPVFEPEDNDIMDNEIPDNTYNGRVIVMGEIKAKDTPECLVCEHLVKELEKEVDPKSRDKIKKVLDHACDKVKESMKQKCDAFIQKHEEQIIDLVMKGTQPKEICTALGFCILAGRDREPIEDVMDQMNPYADDLDIDEAISIDFISMPAGFGSPMGRIQLINKPIEEQRQPPKVQNDQGCVMCEFLMTKLEADLKNKSTQEEIRNAFENVCSKFPKTIQGKCTKFVDSYAEMIISLLATTPPAEICQKLQMCKPPAMELFSVMDRHDREVFECAVCQGAVSMLDHMLEDPKFDRDLETVVEKTCGVAPMKYKKPCREMIESYGPSMINMLLARAQPEKVCEEIQLCFPNEYSTFVKINDEVIPSRIRRSAQVNPRRRRQLGAKKCTWGPSYWCDSLANAQECNATDHCLEKHWNGVKPSA